MPIRQISPEDAPAFQQLRLRGLQECPEAFSSSYEEEVDTPIDTVSRRLAPKPDGAVWGYFDGSRLVGLVGVQREAHRKLSHKAVIWGMYVAPEHRRNGVGRALIAHALKYATETLRVRSVNLGVNTQNTAALTLYRGMGFETYGTERGFLIVDGASYDEHLMVRDLCTASPN